MIKTYKCPIHGEFDHECSINDGELKECTKSQKIEMPNRSLEFKKCNQPVTRVFKPIHYTDCVGFCGRSYIKG